MIDQFARAILTRLSDDKHRKTETELAKEETEQKESPRERRRTLEFLSYIDSRLDLAGHSVLDIGCGSGSLCVEIAKRGAARVVGIDIDANRIEAARTLADSEGVATVTDFICGDFTGGETFDEKFDVVISKAAFEHIPDLPACLRGIADALGDGGNLITLFGPLWGSPYGAHMQEFIRVPWAHFLFPEKVVLAVRQEQYRPSEAVSRYEDIKGHLNRITVRRFRQYAENAGFDINVLRLNPAQDRGVYRLPNKLINALPLLRELGSLQLFAILQKRSAGDAQA